MAKREREDGICLRSATPSSRRAHQERTIVDAYRARQRLVVVADRLGLTCARTYQIVAAMRQNGRLPPDAWSRQGPPTAESPRPSWHEARGEERDRRILEAVAKDLPIGSIAGQLRLTEATVAAHIARLVPAKARALSVRSERAARLQQREAVILEVHEHNGTVAEIVQRLSPLKEDRVRELIRGMREADRLPPDAWTYPDGNPKRAGVLPDVSFESMSAWARGLREHRGLSVDALSALAGVDLALVRGLEGGVPKVELATLAAVAQATDVSTGALVEAFFKEPPLLSGSRPFQTSGPGGPGPLGLVLREARTQSCRASLEDVGRALRRHFNYVGNLERGAVGSPRLLTIARLTFVLSADRDRHLALLARAVLTYAGELVPPATRARLAGRGRTHSKLRTLP